LPFADCARPLVGQTGQRRPFVGVEGEEIAHRAGRQSDEPDDPDVVLFRIRIGRDIELEARLHEFLEYVERPLGQ
jgi:hypothetical protein